MTLARKTVVGQWLAPAQTVGTSPAPAQGKVIFTLSNEITDDSGNVIVAPGPITANLDISGSISIRLYVTDVLGLDQPETYYRVTEQISGAPRRTYNIQIHSNLADPTDITDLDPFALSPGVSNAVLVETINEHIAATTEVHGIADTALLETAVGSQNKANAAQMSAQAYADSLVGVGNQARPGNTYVFNQVSPSASWIISHNLHSFPSVTVVDSSGGEAEGVITYNSNLQLTVQFAAAFAGTAYLN